MLDETDGLVADAASPDVDTLDFAREHSSDVTAGRFDPRRRLIPGCEQCCLQLEAAF